MSGGTTCGVCQRSGSRGFVGGVCVNTVACRRRVTGQATNDRWTKLDFTTADYDRLLAAQDGHCALCPSVPKTKRLQVDHDHKTGRVRGLLCFRCNKYLHGWMDAAWLLGAALYVTEDTSQEPWAYIEDYLR